MLFHLRRKEKKKTARLFKKCNECRGKRIMFDLFFLSLSSPFLFVSSLHSKLFRVKICFQMIPDSESVCQTSEAAVRSTDDVYRKIKNVAEGEAASVTAWKRYQQLVAIVESRGGKFNRKSMIEAIFRGNDLVYASH